MTTPQVHVHNIQTGEEYDRDMTPEELAEIEAFNAVAD
jgi:hypothetical protein